MSNFLSPSRVNLASATAEQLQQLTETCAPATFGVNQKDVLDETYRKAGKLDASDFSIRFDPLQAGLIKAVRTELVEEGRSSSANDVRAELYKLNVYGEALFTSSLGSASHSPPIAQIKVLSSKRMSTPRAASSCSALS